MPKKAGKKAKKEYKKMHKKAAIEIHEVGLWIIAIAVLAIVILGIFLLKEKGINLIEKIRELLRFGR